MCDGLSIKLSEVVAIGDDDNDAEMLESAGLAGIAMKNAAVGAAFCAKCSTQRVCRVQILMWPVVTSSSSNAVLFLLC